MKTFFYLKAIILIAIVFDAGWVHAQKYNIDWAKGIGKTKDEGISSIAVDKAGNIYSVGFFKDTLDFDSGPGSLLLNGYNNVSTDSTATFIYKTNAQGEPIWVKKFHGMSNVDFNDRPHITIDATDNIYITGTFLGTVDFDPGPLTRNITAQSGMKDLYMVKLDTAGNLIWVKTIGGGASGILSVAIKHDVSGNVYIAGSVGTDMDSIDFNPGPAVAKQPTNSFGHIFILKLTSAGNYAWAKTIGRVQDVYDMDVDIDGNVVLTGCYSDSVDFDPGPGISNLICPWIIPSMVPGRDIFITKFNNGGDFLWAKSMGGLGIDWGMGIATDISGNIYTTGMIGWDVFTGSSNVVSDFDPGPDTYNIVTNGVPDAFISKLSPAGSFIWAKRIGGISLDYATAITATDDGRIYTVLHVTAIDSLSNPSVDFDPNSSVFKVNFATVSEARMGISVLDTAGNFAWGGILGPMDVAIAPDRKTSIVINDNDDIYVGGEYTLPLVVQPTPVDFDPGPSSIMVNYGSMEPLANATSDIYFMKLSRCEETKAVTAQDCDQYVFKGKTYTQTGTYVHTVSNPGICDTAFTLNITINKADTAITRTGITLTATVPNATYQWIDCNDGNVPIAGATNASFTPPVDGSYAVIVTNGNCSDTSSCHTVTGTGVAQAETNNMLRIYPNPAQKNIVVTTQHELNNASIRLVNLLGQVVLHHTGLKGRSFPIDISSLPSAVYMIEVMEGDKTQKIKLIKQ